ASDTVLSSSFQTKERKAQARMTTALRELFFRQDDVVQIIRLIGLRLVASGDNCIDDTAKLFRVPMPSRLPPLLRTGIGDHIAHRSLNLAPQGRIEHSVSMRKIHRLKIFEEAIEEGAKPELGNS